MSPSQRRNSRTEPWASSRREAKNAGRLSLNPIKHLDLVGLVMLVVVKVGWAKPVPVDARYFKRPRQGMALTALAGPVSNFVLALLAVGASSLVWHLTPRKVSSISTPMTYFS